MSALYDVIYSFYDFIKSILFIDFTDYNGSLPTELLSLYSYIDTFFMLLIIGCFIWFVYSCLFFITSLGGVRK